MSLSARLGLATAFLVTFAANAGAVTLSIGVSTGGPIATLATSAAVDPLQVNGAVVGNFTFNNVTAGTGPSTFATNTFDTATLTGGTITLYASVQGVTFGNASASQIVDILSGFTVNLLQAGWTVTEQSFFDAGNVQYGQSVAMGSAAFAAIGSSAQSNSVFVGGAPYSLTEVFTITAPSEGIAQLSIAMTGEICGTIRACAPPLNTPLPGGLPLLITALGAGGLLRRRRKATAPVLNTIRAVSL